MERWHTSWLGLKQFPTELSTFDLDQLFTLDAADQQIVASRRHRAEGYRCRLDARVPGCPQSRFFGLE